MIQLLRVVWWGAFGIELGVTGGGAGGDVAGSDDGTVGCVRGGAESGRVLGGLVLVQACGSVLGVGVSLGAGDAVDGRAGGVPDAGAGAGDGDAVGGGWGGLSVGPLCGRERGVDRRASVVVGVGWHGLSYVQVGRSAARVPAPLVG